MLDLTPVDVQLRSHRRPQDVAFSLQCVLWTTLIVVRPVSIY